MKPNARHRYVQEILERYRSTPGTRGRILDADRQLAEDLYQRGISARTIRDALLLAAARRTFRDPALGPLQPIGSLRYFLPVIQEIQRQPIDPGYRHHIKSRLAQAYAEPAADHHRST